MRVISQQTISAVSNPQDTMGCDGRIDPLQAYPDLVPPTLLSMQICTPACAPDKTESGLL